MVYGDELYKHWKGTTYRIILVARNSDDCSEEIVVYKSLEDSVYPKGTIWTRPLKDFEGLHKSGCKRFTQVSS